MLLVNVTRLLIYLLFMMRNCFLICVSGLITAYIICCLVNVTLDTILGIEDVLSSWFLIILVLLDVALLFVCCLIRCKHLRLSDVSKHTYLLTSLLSLSVVYTLQFHQQCNETIQYYNVIDEHKINGQLVLQQQTQTLKLCIKTFKTYPTA